MDNWRWNIMLINKSFLQVCWPKFIEHPVNGFHHHLTAHSDIMQMVHILMALIPLEFKGQQ